MHSEFQGRTSNRIFHNFLRWQPPGALLSRIRYFKNLFRPMLLSISSFLIVVFKQTGPGPGNF